MLEDHGEEPVLPLAPDEVLVDDDVGREEAEARARVSTLFVRMTVKSPSPVIITSLWQAVPAEVPPTTAPRRKAAAMASPTGVPRRAPVIRIWSPPPKKMPPALRASAA